VTALQGTPPKRVRDSYGALKAWFNGADYQAALKIGEKYATFRRFAIEGQQIVETPAREAANRRPLFWGEQTRATPRNHHTPDA
jgi:hypothetical protein